VGLIVHHPIFSKWPGFVGERPEGVIVNWIGAQFRGGWYNQSNICELSEFAAPLPEFGEGYFEWIDVLEAVAAARERFVMIDVGAGYGLWGVVAARAAMQRGLQDFLIRFVEAEPQHAAWTEEAIRMNGLADRGVVIRGAISYSPEPVPLTVASPEGFVASNWYGQRIGWERELESTGSDYFGYPLYRSPLGYEQILVPPVTFETVASGLKWIDLVDMDIQGAELELVTNSISTLTARVRRVHIGTHGADIEASLRQTFNGAGWIPVWDFGCFGRRETPFGMIDFEDGVQCWVNPHIV
jgi:FkbM family methyltransferase